MRGGVYQVFGLNRSYFTRKVTGYLEYKGIPWVLRRAGGLPPDLVKEGFPGGIPAVRTPEGELMWDSTEMIQYLDRRYPEPGVFPSDRVQLFLSYLIDDYCDEWLYRPAVGSRWYVEEDTRVGGYQLGREMTLQLPVSADQAHVMSGAFVRSSCGPLGVTAENIGVWIDEVLRPWMRVMGRHLEATPYLFGLRASLADFAVFGGCAAHFTNDPACRRWMDEDAPALVRHTHRLLEPYDDEPGEWHAGDVPESLLAVLSDAGRLYLPWVSEAAVRGEAELTFANGQSVTIRATEFLKSARSVLLARYRSLRTDALDAVLERAGILRFFADHVTEAGSVPVWETPPRPKLNRPYPPEGDI